MKSSFVFEKSLQWASLGLALSVMSCTMGPDYVAPELNVPEVYRSSQKKTDSSIADLPWWKVFKNSGMKNIIEDCLENNKDLAMAVARCEQARETVAITRSDMFPQLDYQAGAGRGKNSAFGATSPTQGMTTNSGVYGGNISWYLDIWGKVRRQTEASMAQYLATEEARHGVVLSLVGQAALYYLQLLELDEELRITHKTIKSFQISLDLFQSQLEGGVGDILQVSSAQAALAAAAAQVPLIETQIAQTENALSILMGKPPGKISRQGSLEDIDSSVHIPTGIPAQLLGRRPDLRQAEQSLRAANAQVGVAITNYFPSISLTSSLGQVSADLSKMTTKNSASWGLGANLTGPLFTAGALSASERQAKAAFQEAKVAYEKAMLNALGEVSNTLISRQKLVEVIAHRESSVKAYSTSVEASMDRFKQGLANYYEVLQAQQNLFPMEVSLCQSRLAYAQSFVRLYMALGGGWNSEGK